MKRFLSLGLVALATLSALAQTFPKSVSKSAATERLPGVTTPAVPVSLEDRRAALNTLFAEMWEDHLRHTPEFASAIGDKRYNDQLSDDSVAAYNDQLSRGRDY